MDVTPTEPSEGRYKSNPDRPFSPPPYQPPPDISASEFVREFWTHHIRVAEESEDDFKHQSLPLARIKKVMKSDPDVKMIASEVPILFSKACEIFISELTARSYLVAESSKRRTLIKSDVAAAISKSDMFDFLIDIVPREEMANQKKDGKGKGKAGPEDEQEGAGNGRGGRVTGDHADGDAEGKGKSKKRKSTAGEAENGESQEGGKKKKSRRKKKGQHQEEEERPTNISNIETTPESRWENHGVDHTFYPSAGTGGGSGEYGYGAGTGGDISLDPSLRTGGFSNR